MYRCLIVEDNPVNYMIMQNQMAKFGLRADICENGREAVEYCRAFGMPQLVMLDGYMPEMDGLDFLKWLRAQPDGEKSYVLFCSSSLERVSVADAFAHGADCHFPKPIRPEQLQQVMDALKQRFGGSSACMLA